ncbi:DUF86 domain-containing protein [soil metagenome]
MHRDPRAYLWDVQSGVDAILEFTSAGGRDDYLADRMLRSAVERQFEIIGEALNQLSKVAPEIAQRVPDHRQVVAFRNLLIHGYAAVDHAMVWGLIQEQLAPLRDRVVQMLTELGEAW